MAPKRCSERIEYVDDGKHLSVIDFAFGGKGPEDGHGPEQVTPVGVVIVLAAHHIDRGLEERLEKVQLNATGASKALLRVHQSIQTVEHVDVTTANMIISSVRCYRYNNKQQHREAPYQQT